MNFMPKKHEFITSYIYSIYSIPEFPEGKERKREREKFCVINVKYKEISWRVRKGEGRRRRKEK